jgi:hypothetical protein
MNAPFYLHELSIHELYQLKRTVHANLEQLARRRGACSIPFLRRDAKESRSPTEASGQNPCVPPATHDKCRRP